MGLCYGLEKVAKDGSSAYFMISSKPLTSCKRFYDCSVVVAPLTTGILGSGVGWMFKKRSPFLQIFNHYFYKIEESGSYQRLRRRRNRPEFDLNYYRPELTCKTHKGKPVGIYKISSVFAIVAVGVGIGFLVCG